MRDIENREDIDRLLRAFYAKVFPDELIGFIFTDVAHLDLEHHLPIIGDFWENVLLGTNVYTRNPMEPHFKLNKKVTLLPAHFERWLMHFSNTVHEYFRGEIAELACKRAESIAAIMQIKLNQLNQ